MNEPKEYIGAAVGLILGAGMFWGGFHVFRKKQMVDNIPTSTVRGMAMGLVELSGRPSRGQLLKAPLSGEECVLYTYKIQRHERRGKSSRWVTVASGNSFNISFDLEDDTGKVNIIPAGAELISNTSFEFTTRWGLDIPANLRMFLQTRGINYQGLFGNYTMRFTEQNIRPFEPLYVLGTAQKPAGAVSSQEERNQRLVDRLNQIKNDTQAMKAADADSDGNITDEEWQNVVSKVEAELLQNDLAAQAQSGHPDVIVGQGANEKIFIISDKDPKDIGGALILQIVVGIFGGGLLMIGGFWYLLVLLKVI